MPSTPEDLSRSMCETGTPFRSTAAAIGSSSAASSRATSTNRWDGNGHGATYGAVCTGQPWHADRFEGWDLRPGRHPLALRNGSPDDGDGHGRCAVGRPQLIAASQQIAIHRSV